MKYKKNQTLIITTGYFPFGNVEKSFLAEEILFLAKAFKKVIIIPQNFSGEKSSLPENVEINYAFKEAFRKRGSLFEVILSFLNVFLYVFFHTPFKKKYLKHVRYLFAYFRTVWKQYLVFKQAIKPYLKTEEVVLYSYWFNSYATALCLLKRKNPTIKLIARVHGFDLYNERSTIGFQPFRSFQLKYTDRLFVISKTGYSYLKVLFPAYENKMELSYLGTPDAGVNPDAKNKEELHIVSCAFVSKVKRLHLIPETLRHTNIKIKWTHIGGGDQLNELKNKTRDLPSNVTCDFLGSIENKQVQGFFQKNHVDVFLSVSESEGIPFGMMEAASFGIPIITTNVGGVKEVVTPQTGRLITKDFNPIELASMLNSFFLSELSTNEFRNRCRNFWNENFNAANNYQTFIKQIPGKDPSLSFVYKQCSRCILDSKDDVNILIDSHGICNYCRHYDNLIAKLGPLKDRLVQLQTKVAEIKLNGNGKKYDCILGISGGVDSSYLTYWAKQEGLRPLVVHMDNGWNSELAVNNIQALCAQLEFDLYTHVINWEEFRELQLAYLRASVVDIEVLTDHAISAVIYGLAAKHKIKYAINGYNYATEAVMPKGWTYDKTDFSNISDIIRKHSTIKRFRSFPTITFRKKLYYYWFLKLEPVHVLNYMEYNKAEAKQFLIEKFGWRDYGGKHFESVFTKFYQIYILPEKFHIDKRKAHLSNLVCSGQISRDQALWEIANPLYDEKQMLEEKNYVLKKLGLTDSEFDVIMGLPPHDHQEFDSDQRYWNKYFAVVGFLRLILFRNKK